MNRFQLLLPCLAALSASSAFAGGFPTNMAEVAAMGRHNSSNCLVENASINVNFMGTEPDASVIKAKFDAKMAEIEKIVNGSGVAKSEIQSMSYSINPQNYGGNQNSSYQFNASVNYTVVPASKATDIMTELTKKGYQAGVNVNAYRNGGMPCATTPSPQTKEQ